MRQTKIKFRFLAAVQSVVPERNRLINSHSGDATFRLFPGVLHQLDETEVSTSVFFKDLAQPKKNNFRYKNFA